MIPRNPPAPGPSPDLDQLLNAIAHGVRREILNRLLEGETTAGALAAPYDLSLPAISRHLRVLEEAHLIQRRKVGREHHIQLVPETLRGLDQWLVHYRTFWEEQLDALSAHLENE